MENLERFEMADQQARLHLEQEGLKWAVRLAYENTKEIERHYRARLIRALERMGIGPIAVAGENDPVDLYIGEVGQGVELKVARARERPRADHSRPRAEYYQGLLWDRGNGHYLNGDLLILLCVDPEDHLWPFVVPRDKLGNRRTIEITSAPAKYRGQWAPFLGRLDLLKRGGKP